MQTDSERLAKTLVSERKLHFGIITPPVSGHIHPFGALGRELMARGHRVTVLHMADLKSRVSAEDLDFIPIGATDHPLGSLADSLAELAKRQGLSALRFTIDAVRKTTEMMCRDAPTAIRSGGIDVLLVDQTEPAGGAIADHLGIPFITVCNALLLTEELDVPPPFTSWSYRPSPLNRARNWLGYRISGLVMRPVMEMVNSYRRRWSLVPYSHPSDSYSPICQISQQPAAFDFPRKQLPGHFHYVGPLRRTGSRLTPTFPWNRLNGKPVVYASLGTLQNRRGTMFRNFAQACAPLPVQLVMTHGGGLDLESTADFPGDPIVVSYAPQLDVLARATLTLTHAGLNTVLDSLTQGVPLVAIPITYEQPAIASRIQALKVGEVLTLAGLTPDKIRRAVDRVLVQTAYSERANDVKAAISRSGGVESAVKLIESTCGIA